MMLLLFAALVQVEVWCQMPMFFTDLYKHGSLLCTYWHHTMCTKHCFDLEA
jgi:hypothetical protein